MSTRAEIRHMHLTEGVPKKEVARRLGVDVKTVRRHVRGDDPYPDRQTPKRGRALDGHRAEIMWRRPPQFGQRSTSSPNTLSKSSAHGM